MNLGPIVTAPDPYAPMPLVAGIPADQQQARRRQQLRRAEILAVTRRHVAEAGCQQFTVRRVADECGVTVQTIYNWFGGREELLVRSLNEHTTMTQEHAAANCADYAVLMALADVYFHCASRTPAFLKELVGATMLSEYTVRTMLGHGVERKANLLRQLSVRRIIRERCEPHALASQITRISMVAVYEWTLHQNARELREQMTHGTRLLLMGSLCSSAAEQIEAWVPASAAKTV